MLDWKVLSVVKRKGERWGVSTVDLGTYLRDVAQKEGANWNPFLCAACICKTEDSRGRKVRTGMTSVTHRTGTGSCFWYW